jgi:hypothetical protein
LSFTFFEFHQRFSKVVSPFRLFAANSPISKSTWRIDFPYFSRLGGPNSTNAYSPIRQFAKIRRIDFPYFSRPGGVYSPIRQFAGELPPCPIRKLSLARHRAVWYDKTRKKGAEAP